MRGNFHLYDLPPRKRRQLLKKIAENRITLNVAGVADEMAGGVYTPGDLIGQDGAVDQFGGHPARVEDVGHGQSYPKSLWTSQSDRCCNP